MRSLTARKAWSSRDRLSLLANPSPPNSPSPFERNDPNISTLFPSVHEATDSFDDAMKIKQSVVTPPKPSNHNNNGGFPPQPKEISPTDGALQFVPAYEEATSPATTNPSTSTSPENSNNTSWDAAAQDNHHHHHNSRLVTPNKNNDAGIFRRKAKSVVSASPSSSGYQNQSNSNPNPNAAMRKRTDDAASTVSGMSSARRQGTRIARLASLFSSRAVVSGRNNNNNNNNNNITTNVGPAPQQSNPPSEPPKPLAPVSPSRSDSSGGYVGWPGTQDRRGGTVAVESSYEESDVGVRKNYSSEMQEAVDREVSIWMDDDDDPSFADSDKSTTPKPQRIMEQLRHFNAKEELEPKHTTSTSESDGENPADFHLAAAVADASALASPMLVKPRVRSSHSKVHPEHGMSTPLTLRVNSVQDIYGEDQMLHPEHNVVSSPMTDSWGLDTSSDTLSSGGASKTSSAYFSPRDYNAMRNGGGKTDHVFGVGQKKNVAAAVMRMKAGEPQPPTEEMLAIKDHLQPPHRTFHASGYAGLLNKTKDVPNLMDDEVSESSQATSRASSFSGVNPPSAYRSRARNMTTRLRTNDEMDEDILEEASSDVFDSLGSSPRRQIRSDGSVPESDVFDGLSAVGSNAYTPRGAAPREYGIRGAAPRESNSTDPYRTHITLDAISGKPVANDLNFVMLGGGLTTIQTTTEDFSKRRTASDFDENLTHSDYDQYGFARIPGFSQMASAGQLGDGSFQNSSSLPLSASHSRRPLHALESHGHKAHLDQSNGGSDSGGSSLFSDPYHRESRGHNVVGDLSQYYVQPDQMKKLVRKFRKMSKNRPNADLSYDDLDREEDAVRAFALSEMRSRIMEKDIERGLERRGGTTIVDDIVLTPYNRAALRVRDAVIVSKAWRDGATPRDVINTAMLTRRDERSYFIKRPLWFWGDVSNDVTSSEYGWEEVAWVDDMDFTQYRCLSLGSRPMRGYEMFTIGDCQSILLKLTNERCLELRNELNEAISRQLEAEELMKEEADPADGMMTEAEMTYLTSMEEVKIISHKLVVAEKAFTLVRDRIEKLVAKYEALLVRFENESASVAASSVITYESSYYSDGGSSTDEEERERDALTRRAQRAELRAEVAARESLLAKQEAQIVRVEKQRELHSLQMRLAELQSESSTAIAEREHSVVLARVLSTKKANNIGNPSSNKAADRTSKSKIDDVKQRFRDRTAAKMLNSSTETASTFSQSPSTNRSYRMNSDMPQSQDNAARERSNLFRTVGEEMFQHLDFYERSLKAVESTR